MIVFLLAAHGAPAFPQHPLVETQEFRGAERNREPQCPLMFTEFVFHSIVSSILSSELLPPGVIIDAGANDGSDSCVYADLAPTRTVHAIDPLPQNVRSIERYARTRPNLRPFRIGLGNVTKIIKLPDGAVQAPAGLLAQVSNFAGLGPGAVLSTTDAEVDASSFIVRRVDDLFLSAMGPWLSERLAFAHLDLEGAEFDVVESAVQTIMRDRPVLTVEVNVHRELLLTQRLLGRIHSFGYSTYVVQENCGTPWADCRNVLAFPNEWMDRQRHAAHAGGAPALDVAFTTGRLAHVTAGNVAAVAGYPVCARGQLCCRGIVAGFESLGYCPCLISCVAPWMAQQPSSVTSKLAPPVWNARQDAGLRGFFETQPQE